jgi:hypothetical protein
MTVVVVVLVQAVVEFVVVVVVEEEGLGVSFPQSALYIPNQSYLMLLSRVLYQNQKNQICLRAVLRHTHMVLQASLPVFIHPCLQFHHPFHQLQLKILQVIYAQSSVDIWIHLC